MDTELTLDPAANEDIPIEERVPWWEDMAEKLIETEGRLNLT